MTNNLPPWVKLPSQWIEEGGLDAFRWAQAKGADNLAALMGLTVISHNVDPNSAIARLTYDELCDRTTLSRAKLSAGLNILSECKLIEREPLGRSSYRLANYNPAEFDALKLYFLFASRRDRKTNMAKISYEKIEAYSGIDRNKIRRALSVLAANALVHIEMVPSKVSENGVAYAYRLAHLNTRRHMGTWGRGADEYDFDDLKE